MRYDAASLGADAMGWVCENQLIVAALHQRLRAAAVATAAEAAAVPGGGGSAGLQLLLGGAGMIAGVQLPLYNPVAQASPACSLLRVGGFAPAVLGSSRFHALFKGTCAAAGSLAQLLCLPPMHYCWRPACAAGGGPTGEAGSRRRRQPAHAAAGGCRWPRQPGAALGAGAAGGQC